MKKIFGHCNMLLKKAIIFLLKLYRKFISPLFPPCCRFTPTCSKYAVEAIEKRGVVVGCLLAAYRVLRCNPFCKGGFDPVPERGFFKHTMKGVKKKTDGITK